MKAVHWCTAGVVVSVEIAADAVVVVAVFVAVVAAVVVVFSKFVENTAVRPSLKKQTFYIKVKVTK